MTPDDHRSAPCAGAGADERTELTLTISPGPGGAFAVHARSPDGARHGTFAPPEGVSTAGDRGRCPDEVDRHVVAEAPARLPPPGSRGEGALLFEALFADPGLRALYETTRAGVPRGGFRLRLVIDPDPSEMAPVSAAPWERLFDRDRGERLACEGGSVVRSLAVRRPPRPFEPPERLRVLALLSGAADLDLELERRSIVELASEATSFDVAVETAVDLETLEELLLAAEARRRPFHVLHLAGHGDLAPGPEGGVLVWEPPGQLRSDVAGRDLSALLRRFRDLQLVVLNACTTADLPEGRDPFSGVAAALLQGGVPAVVAVRGRILDRAAILFTRTFYRCLAHAGSPEQAMNAARWTLWKMDPGGTEWAKPVLFQARPDPAPRLPRWLHRTAAGLLAAVLVLALAGAWQHRALRVRSVEAALATAREDVSHARPQQARRGLLVALDRLPHPPPRPELVAALRSTLSTAEHDLGDLEAALRSAREAAELDPKRASYRYNLGVLLARAGRPAEAVAPLRRALALEPDHADAANELGRVLLELERPGDARAVLEPAAAAHPEHGLLHKNLGRTLFVLGEREGAVRHLRRALELLPAADRLAREEARSALVRAGAGAGGGPGAP